MAEQILISFIILLALIFFIWGRWRHDIVALSALFAATMLGLISFDEIFLGFVHPVVILIVAVLIISKGLINSGAVDFVARYFKFGDLPLAFQLGILVTFSVVLSAFINSLGALAFIIPIAARVAKQTKMPLSLFLIPVAFGSHFGGNLTLIGSASNIIVSGFRSQEFSPFGFFDFAPVAFPIAIVGIIFIAIFAQRFLPKREDIFSRAFALRNYLTELRIPEDSSLIGKTFGELQNFSKEHFKVLALIRDDEYVDKPHSLTPCQKDDILVVESQTSSLETIITMAGLEFLNRKPFLSDEKNEKDFEIGEAVVSESSYLRGETAESLGLRHNYQVNLFAINRSAGFKTKKRIANIFFQAGDVLLLQGAAEKLNEFIKFFDLLPLKEHEFHFEGKKKKALLASGIFLSAVLLSALNFLPVHFIFAAAAVAIIIGGFVPPRNMYDSVDFSLIVLVAVMLQLGNIFAETGAASWLAEFFFLFKQMSPEIALASFFLATILFSDILSNVTVAVLFSPLAFAFAQHLGVSSDPFLMAVAIGAGSSYLTPTGNQSNIFVMGLGGYRFADYWRLGLPLEIITFVLGIFLIPYFWPF